MLRNSTQYVCLGALTTVAMVCGFAKGLPKAPAPEPDMLVRLDRDFAPEHVALRSFAQKKPAAGLTVLLHDYTGLPQTALAEMESETSLLLSRTGIRIQWVLCRAAWIPEMPEDCRAKLAAGQLVMRIVERRIGPQGRRGDPLGSAQIEGQYATLYSAGIRRAAAIHGVRFGSLMAYAAAHEIGHLLLGPRHGRAGMMQAAWGKNEYRDMAQRWLGFDAAERYTMQGRVRERVHAGFGER